jgi:hypothetical protein
MSSRWTPECFCYYEHPVSRCGAKTKDQRGDCKFYLPNRIGDCAHLCCDSDNMCDNRYANFEAYAILIKDQVKPNKSE